MAVGFRIADARGHRLGAPHRGARGQCRRQRLHAQSRVGAQVVTRHFLALTQRPGIDVDMQHLRLRPELTAAAGVVGEGAADRDDQVGLRQILEPDLGREAARDADAVQVVVEESSCRQRRGQQSTRLGGQRPARGPRLGFDRAQAGKHDHAFGGRNQLRGLRHVIRMRWHRREARQQFLRGRRQLLRSGPGPFLQIERNADHHRASFAARLQERIANRDRHALGQVQGMVVRARCLDDRRLIDPLVVPAALERRLSGKHHQRQMGTHGRRERRDQLRDAGPAGDRCNAHFRRLARVGHRGCDGAMLVPDVDHATSLLGQSRRPVHVRIAHQRKAGAHALLDEGLGKDIVDMQFGFSRHRCNSRRLASTSLTPSAPAILRRHRRRERTSIGKIMGVSTADAHTVMPAITFHRSVFASKPMPGTSGMRT